MNLIKSVKVKIASLSFKKTNENSIKSKFNEFKVEYRKLLFITVTNIYTNRYVRLLFKLFLLSLTFVPVWAIGYIWRTVQSEFYLPYEINKAAKYENTEIFRDVNDYNRMKLSFELTKYY